MDKSHVRLLKKISDEKWVVSHAVIQHWLDTLNQRMQQYRSPAVAAFQIEEAIHYLTLAELQACIVPIKPEYRVVKALYAEREATRVPEKRGLQDPAITFGENIKARLCPKCRTECRQQAIQKRSSDEPTSYYFQCKSHKCGYGWKDR